MKNVIEHTNARLENWYVNAKRDFGVIGKGWAKYNNRTNEVEINYTENGTECIFKHCWHPDFKISTIFDIWQTDANPENDKL
jgi:hypothetical protein